MSTAMNPVLKSRNSAGCVSKEEGFIGDYRVGGFEQLLEGWEGLTDVGYL